MIRSKRPSGKADVGLFYLKIKVVSLAEEARVIRRHERAAKAVRDHALTQGLSDHRRGIVRQEARAALLAYGFLRGRSYAQLEPSCHEEPDWGRVTALVKKYGATWAWEEDEPYKDWQKRQSEVLSAFLDWVP